MHIISLHTLICANNLTRNLPIDMPIHSFFLINSTSGRGHFHTPHHCLAETALSALAALTTVLPGTPSVPGGAIATTLQPGGSSTTKVRQPYYLEPLAIACLLRTLRGCVGMGRIMVVSTNIIMLLVNTPS